EGQPEPATAEFMDLDLHPRQEEEERETEERHDLDRQVDPDEPDARRSEQDPRDDQQHDGGNPAGGRDGERDRDDKRGGRDDQQPHERDVGVHGATRRSMARAGPPSEPGMRSGRPMKSYWPGSMPRRSRSSTMVTPASRRARWVGVGLPNGAIDR